jgi:hypothetical protein
MPYFNDGVLARFDGPTDYFEGRGIDRGTIQEFGLRYADAVTKSAPLKRYEDGSLEKTDEDYVGPASIWPHYWKGHLVGWQYRWHDWDHAHTKTPRWLPKWTNTTDFPKSTTLYNYDRAIKVNAPVIVCESLGTVGFVHTCGFPAVAWFGSSPTEAQVRLLRRFSQGVIFAPDNDSNAEAAKIYAKIKSAATYLQSFVPVFILDRVTPEDVGFEADGLDLNDYAKTDDPEAKLFDHLIKRINRVGIFGLEL